MTLSNFFLSSGRVHLISDLKLIVLTAIGTSLHSIVIGTGRHPNNIAYDVVI